MHRNGPGLKHESGQFTFMKIGLYFAWWGRGGGTLFLWFEPHMGYIFPRGLQGLKFLQQKLEVQLGSESYFMQTHTDLIWTVQCKPLNPFPHTPAQAHVGMLFYSLIFVKTIVMMYICLTNYLEI